MAEDTREFNLLWTGDHDAYQHVVATARDALRKVPNMTDQTLGFNGRYWVSNYFTDHPESLHAEQFLRVAPFWSVDEEEVADAIREALSIEFPE